MPRSPARRISLGGALARNAIGSLLAAAREIREHGTFTFVNNATDQVPTDNLAQFAQPFEFSEMMKAALAVPELISFTVWGFTDADSWVPGFFTGEGYATLYDVNLNPKPAYYALQSDLALAASGVGAPRRVRTPMPRP